MFFRHIQALQPAHGGSFEALLRGLPGYCSVHIFDKVWGRLQHGICPHIQYSNPVIRCAKYLLKYFQGFLKTRFNQEARPGFQSVLSELATTLPRFHFFFPLDARWKQWESSNMKETIMQITCRSPFYYNENLQKVLIAPNGFNTRMVRDISWDTTNTNTHTYSWTLWRVLREWLRQLDRL